MRTQRTRRLRLLAVIVVLAGPTLWRPAATAQTVAYWRFEDAAPKQLIEGVADVSGSGNDLRAFSADTAPTSTTLVPFDAVPQTGDRNVVALDNTARPGARFPTRDLFVSGSTTAFNLNTDALEQWTIEASVLFKPVDRWQQRFQTFVGRDGYNIPNGPAENENPLAALGFKKRGDNNRISIEAWDSTQYVVVESLEPVQPDVWYHVAATSDGKTLTLWLKGPSDSAYTRQGERPFNGAMANTGELWTVGRGCFASGPAEQFFGYIDEVRISAAALPPERLLASPRKAGQDADPKPATLPKSARPPALKFGGAATRPANAVPIHDPMIIQAGGAYHVFASHGGFVHWRSTDLLNWEPLPGIFADAPQWAKRDIAERPGLWAPDVVFFNNRFHVYYSISTWGSQRSAIGLVVNDSLDPQDAKFKWLDQGKVVESFRGDDFNAIDPSVIVDQGGRPWMAWGSWNKGIYLGKLAPETGMLAADARPYHHIAARPGNNALEAPHLFFHDGWYYLFVSYDLCARGASSTYKLMVGRSRDITGPYVDREDKPMLQGNASLVVRSYGDLRGPGQSSIARQGDRFVLAHHYYDARAGGAPTLAVRPLYWDRDGWPLVGEPLAEAAQTAAPTVSGDWIELQDDVNPVKLSFRDDGSVIGPLGRGRWREQSGTLRITWPKSDDNAEAVVDDCFLSDDRCSYVGRRSNGVIVRARLQAAAGD